MAQKGRARGAKRGSPRILGPLLWNLGFNEAMKRGDLHLDCSVLCYADDTLVLSKGEDWEEATMEAEMAVETIVQRIQDMGLEVAPLKTEVVGFCERGRPANTAISVAGVEVLVGTRMKYLGLTLDTRWTFVPYFEGLSPRLEKAALALSKLLPNLGGPNRKARKLYINVITSMALYGAPIWANEMLKSNKIIRTLRAVQRRITGRLVRAYKTTSFAVNTALAGVPPLELEAVCSEEIYERISNIRRSRAANKPYTEEGDRNNKGDRQKKAHWPMENVD
ncbi:PREDICTED: uncharacterized protein LOC108763667 [Trachymyrmex cornetzi]|uniref:uncharacterized protein LOC108763667 n=1 Tax=Trachymyrmex cornetzi TaxID=471704 RepID=UPI00084F2C1A|nr:PREDICTED: uncharacterized protein LOC108763667 [Trachymyrmex cornetzi]